MCVSCLTLSIRFYWIRLVSVSHFSDVWGRCQIIRRLQCISITYLDADGNPMLNKSGYARVDRELDEENHVVQEMYYGVDGKPKALWGKHYGLRRWAFDDRNNCTEYSYLDINGNPMVITSGYATVKRTFNEDNKVDTNMYYGIDGQPVKLSSGQYGDKHRYDENGKDVEIILFSEQIDPTEEKW